MGNIIFDKIKAHNFLKQMDDQKACMLAAIRHLEQSVTRTLGVWESNGETNEYLTDLQQTLSDLQKDYGAFANDFMEALKNIGTTYEQADENVTKTVAKTDANTPGQSFVQTVKGALDSNIAKPLSQPSNSKANSIKEIYDGVKNKITNDNVSNSTKGNNDTFDKLKSIIEDVADKSSEK